MSKEVNAIEVEIEKWKRGYADVDYMYHHLIFVAFSKLHTISTLYQVKKKNHGCDI